MRGACRTVDLIAGATSTLRARIAARTVREGGKMGCWRWTGGTSRKRDGARRGKVQVGGRGTRVITVARVLLVLKDRVPLVERDSARLEAGHRCGHFWCVNPRHLHWIDRSGNEAEKHEFDEEFDRFSAAFDEVVGAP